MTGILRKAEGEVDRNKRAEGLLPKLRTKVTPGTNQNSGHE